MQLTILLDPVLLTLGPLTISWPGLANALGLALALVVSLIMARRKGVPLQTCLRAAAAGGAVGVAAGRLVDTWQAASCALVAAAMAAAWSTEHPPSRKDGTRTNSSPIGHSLPAAGQVSWREDRPGRERMPRRVAAVRRTIEASVPGMLLGQALGHMGSFLAGGEWGRPTGGLWGVVYWHPHALLPPPLLGIHLHPYALYAGAANVMLAGLWLVLGRGGLAGVRLWLTLVGYAGCQLALNVTRGGEPIVWRH